MFHTCWLVEEMAIAQASSAFITYSFSEMSQPAIIGTWVFWENFWIIRGMIPGSISIRSAELIA